MHRKPVISTSVAVLSLTQLAAAEVAFKPEQTYVVGTSPAAVAVGDFNRDVKLDLAALNFGDVNVGDPGDVSILPGIGAGTFQPAMQCRRRKKLQKHRGRGSQRAGIKTVVLVRPEGPTVNDDGDVTIFFGNGMTLDGKRVTTKPELPRAMPMSRT